MQMILNGQPDIWSGFAGRLASRAVNLAVDIPNPPATQPPGTGGVSNILGYVKWTAIVALVIILIVTTIVYVIQSRRGDGSQGVNGIVIVLFGVAVVSGATAIIASIAS